MEREGESGTRRGGATWLKAAKGDKRDEREENEWESDETPRRNQACTETKLNVAAVCALD